MKNFVDYFSITAEFPALHIDTVVRPEATVLVGRMAWGNKAVVMAASPELER